MQSRRRLWFLRASNAGITDQLRTADQDTSVEAGSVASRTAIGAGWLVAWRLVTRALGLISTLILARILVPADFGLIAMATIFTTATEALSELGLLDALIRRRDTDRKLYDTAFTMQVIRGALTGAVVAACAWAASDWFNEPRLMPVMLLLAALTVISGFDNIGIVEFRRSLRFDMEFKLLLLPRLSGVFTTIAMAWLLQSYWALLIGITVSRLVRVAMTYVVHPYRPGFTLSRWRDLVGFSFWTWASSIAWLVWERCDALILGPVLGPSRLGVYLIAGEIAVLPISELVAPATRSLFAGFAIRQNRGEDTVGLALAVVSAMLLLVVPLAIGVSATSGYIVVGLLGPNWEEARPLIAIFVWLCVASPFSYVCSTILMAAGHVRQNFMAIAGAAAFKALVIYGVAQTGRMDWAAIAGIVCTGVASMLFMVQLRKLGDLRWRESRGGLTRIAASGGMTAALLFASGLGWQPVTLAPVPALLLGGAVGLGAMLAFATTLLGLWWVAGQPQGPETRLCNLVAETVALQRSSRPALV